MIDQQPADERTLRDGRTEFIEDALLTTASALTYRVDAALAARFATRAVVASTDADFDVEKFASAGHCTLAAMPDSHVEVSLAWDVDSDTIVRYHQQGWYHIVWQESTIEVLRLSFSKDSCTETVRWAIADTHERAEAFFAAVARFNSAVDGSILVFQDGYWQKNDDLYQTIKAATLDTLVLGGTLKDDLYRDLRTFFDARAIYERSGVPWKRGIVLIGPPGNGKTHAIKALINALDTTCLYVKSFSTQRADDHHNIRNVFREARERAPCILVLEDLDSLITDHNRSFFLNELDGFAANDGVVTIASTNYPERLDPAIMARPSRFDRKYHFGLPNESERRAYLELWRERLDDAMRPSAATVTALTKGTAGFSFAYVKELMVAATVRWAEHQQAGTMDTILAAELIALCEQMQSQTVAS